MSTHLRRRLVTFDAFGTLFKPKWPIHETYARIAKRHGYAVDPLAIKSSFRTEQSKRTPYYGWRQAYRLPPDDFPWEELGWKLLYSYVRDPPQTDEERITLCRDWWTEVIKSTFTANDVTVSDHFCHDLYAHFSSSEAYALFPDVKPCLQRLHRPKYILGIVSDMDERLEGIVNGLGLGQFFEVIVQGYKFGLEKPNEALYFKAVIAAQEISMAAGGLINTCPWEDGTDFEFMGAGVHVGDNPEKDAFGNAIPVMLDREGTLETRQFHKIRSLKDLPLLIMPRDPRRNKP